MSGPREKVGEVLCFTAWRITGAAVLAAYFGCTAICGAAGCSSTSSASKSSVRGGAGELRARAMGEKWAAACTHLPRNLRSRRRHTRPPLVITAWPRRTRPRGSPALALGERESERGHEARNAKSGKWHWQRSVVRVRRSKDATMPSAIRGFRGSTLPSINALSEPDSLPPGEAVLVQWHERQSHSARSL